MNTSTLTIRLPSEQREALRRFARALKKSESELIRDWIARGLNTRTIGERIGHLAGWLDSSEIKPSYPESFRETIRKRNWRSAS